MTDERENGITRRQAIGACVVGGVVPGIGAVRASLFDGGFVEFAVGELVDGAFHAAHGRRGVAGQNGRQQITGARP